MAQQDADRPHPGRLDAPGCRDSWCPEAARLRCHIPSPQGVPEDPGHRLDRLAPWGLQDRPLLWDQVGRSLPAGQKEEMRVSPTDCGPWGCPYHLGVRGGWQASLGQLKQTKPRPGPRKPVAAKWPQPLGAHSQAHGLLFPVTSRRAPPGWTRGSELLFPHQAGGGGGGSCLLLLKTREVPEEPRSPARLQPESQRTRETHRLCPETEGPNAASPALPRAGREPEPQ